MKDFCGNELKIGQKVAVSDSDDWDLTGEVVCLFDDITSVVLNIDGAPCTYFSTEVKIISEPKSKLFSTKEIKESLERYSTSYLVLLNVLTGAITLLIDCYNDINLDYKIKNQIKKFIFSISSIKFGRNYLDDKIEKFVTEGYKE